MVYTLFLHSEQTQSLNLKNYIYKKGINNLFDIKYVDNDLDILNGEMIIPSLSIDGQIVNDIIMLKMISDIAKKNDEINSPKQNIQNIQNIQKENIKPQISSKFAATAPNNNTVMEKKMSEKEEKENEIKRLEEEAKKKLAERQKNMNNGL